MLQRRDIDTREGAKHAVHIPHTDRFPPADAGKAQQHLATGHVLGKALLRIRHP